MHCLFRTLLVLCLPVDNLLLLLLVQVVLLGRAHFLRNGLIRGGRGATPLTDLLLMLMEHLGGLGGVIVQLLLEIGELLI